MDTAKKEYIKTIIRQLHAGLPVAAARERIVREIGNLSAAEIADIEQSLIAEGMPPEEIQKFCNVHVALFESAAAKHIASPDSPIHPVNLFKAENAAIQRIVDDSAATAQTAGEDVATVVARLREKLAMLNDIKKHYERKEQLLFPLLEKKGFTGPSKVMWGKHNDIRAMLNRAQNELAAVKTAAHLRTYTADILTPLLEEVSGMIFKEEHILFPTALEKLTADEWAQILRESADIGYVYIQVPEEALFHKSPASVAAAVLTAAGGDTITLPTGTLTLTQLIGIFGALPVDITFIDDQDTVRYYSNSPDRIFVRTNAVLGRKVQNCHPPQSVHVVNEILTSFRENRRNSAEFWIDFAGKKVHIRYFAVRDHAGTYLGTLEVTQDITRIQQLTGQKRLLNQ